MIGVPNRETKKTIYAVLPEGWTAQAVAPRREANVGANCLTYVAVLSAFEAAGINDGFKKKAAEELRANRAEKDGHLVRHLYENAVSGGAEVDKLLEAIKEEGYFSSWVIVEECTID
jgi:hypothetical protein